MSFGPEEVREEGAAEDGGDIDANQDVVRGDAAEAVVGAGGVFGDEVLLVDVVCMNNESMLL